MKASVRIAAEDKEQREVELSGHVVTFGRAPDNSIHLEEGVVSGKHGQLERRDGQWFVIDLGSSNGTEVNGERLEPRGLGRRLCAGDRIEVGPFVLTYEEEVEAQEDAPGSGVLDGATVFPQSVGAPKVAKGVAELSAALGDVFARFADKSSEERRAALRKELESRTADWPPRLVAEVLSKLASGVCSEGGAGAEAAPRLDRQEQILRASHDSLVALSKGLTGVGRLDSVEEVQRFEELIQQAMRILIEGLTESIRARMRYGEELDTAGTIMPGLGNPLYDLDTPEEVMAALLDPRRDLRPVALQRHLEGVMTDLKRHQLALVDAARHATKMLMQEFDPAQIEEEFRKGRSGMSRLFRSAWDTYVSKHEDLSNEPRRFFDLVEEWIRDGYRVSRKRMRVEEEGA